MKEHARVVRALQVWRLDAWRRFPGTVLQRLLSKGWIFAGLADEARRRAVAEARPWPPAVQAAEEPGTGQPVGAHEMKRR